MRLMFKPTTILIFHLRPAGAGVVPSGEFLTVNRLDVYRPSTEPGYELFNIHYFLPSAFSAMSGQVSPG